MQIDLTANQIKVLVDSLDECSHMIRKKVLFSPTQKQREMINKFDDLIECLEQKLEEE